MPPVSQKLKPCPRLKQPYMFVLNTILANLIQPIVQIVCLSPIAKLCQVIAVKLNMSSILTIKLWEFGEFRM